MDLPRTIALAMAISLAAGPGLFVVGHEDGGASPFPADDPPSETVAPDQAPDESAPAPGPGAAPWFEPPAARPDLVPDDVIEPGTVPVDAAVPEIANALDAPAAFGTPPVATSSVGGAGIAGDGMAFAAAAPLGGGHGDADDDGDGESDDGNGDDSYGQDRHNLTYCLSLADWQNWTRLINWTAVVEFSESFAWSSFINWTAVLEQVDWSDLTDLLGWDLQDWIDLFGGSGDLNWTELQDVLSVFDQVDWANWTVLVNWSAVEDWLDQVNWSNWQAVFTLFNWSALEQALDAYQDSGCDGWEHGHPWRHFALWFHLNHGNLWSYWMRDHGGWGVPSWGSGDQAHDPGQGNPPSHP